MKFIPLKYTYLLLSLIMAFNITEGQQVNKIHISDIVENVTIDTDRDLYFYGENIYFTSTYFVNHDKKLSLLSTVLYVELINCINNSTVTQNIFKIINNGANGIITIPNDISTGNYMIRAYTQYQRNFSSINYAYHFIRILNPEAENKQIILTNSIGSDSIIIAPEGNILIENVANNVVIRIPSKFLNEKNKYFLTDNSLNVINKIKSINSEIVTKALTFKDTSQYKLLIIRSNGDSIIRKFPKIQKFGIQTSTTRSVNHLIYTLKSKGLISYNQNLNYQLKILSNDYNNTYNKNIILLDSIIDVNIPSTVLDYGINYLLLYDYSGRIIKINSIFNARKQIDAIDLQIDKENYNTRDTIHLKMLVNNAIPEELLSVSVSVTLHGSKKESTDFIPSLYFKNPLSLQDYLNNLTDQTVVLQNQIMILFDESIDKQTFIEKINKKVPILKYIPEIRDLSIGGVLRNKITKEPIANQNVFVSVLTNNPQLHIYKTNEYGEFILSLNNLYGLNNVILSSPSLGNNEYEILVKTPFSNDYPTFGAIPFYIDTQEKGLIEQIYYNTQIQKSFDRNQKKPLNIIGIDTIFNINGQKKSITINDYIRFESMKDLFHEVMPNIRVRRIKGQYSLKVANEMGEKLKGDPLILLDRIPIIDANKIMALDITQVKKVDVIFKTYILGSNIINGIIMVTTNTDDFAGTKFPESYNFIKYQSLETPANISDINTNPSAEIPNFKTTLYWNPQIIINTNSQIINFKASDCKGVWDINVKGYTPKGHIYFVTKQIVVK